MSIFKFVTRDPHGKQIIRMDLFPSTCMLKTKNKKQKTSVEQTTLIETRYSRNDNNISQM